MKAALERDAARPLRVRLRAPGSIPVAGRPTAIQFGICLLIALLATRSHPFPGRFGRGRMLFLMAVATRAGPQEPLVLEWYAFSTAFTVGSSSK
jgi:hypothetical protein